MGFTKSGKAGGSCTAGHSFAGVETKNSVAMVVLANRCEFYRKWGCRTDLWGSIYAIPARTFKTRSLGSVSWRERPRKARNTVNTDWCVLPLLQKMKLILLGVITIHQSVACGTENKNIGRFGMGRINRIGIRSNRNLGIIIAHVDRKSSGEWLLCCKLRLELV